MPAQPTPATGRIVHYVSHGTPLREDGTHAFAPACRATVLNPTGVFFHPLSAGGTLHAPADARAGGSWHWPEVVQ